MRPDRRIRLAAVWCAAWAAGGLALAVCSGANLAQAASSAAGPMLFGVSAGLLLLFGGGMVWWPGLSWWASRPARSQRPAALAACGGALGIIVYAMIWAFALATGNRQLNPWDGPGGSRLALNPVLCVCVIQGVVLGAGYSWTRESRADP